MRRIPSSLAALVVLTAILGACSGAGGSPAVSISATAAVPAATASLATTAGAPTPGTAAKVSANTASESEIAAALSAAGVINASRWAKEVVEYRPYDVSDPTLAKLQNNLAKYNPDPATLAAILLALKP